MMIVRLGLGILLATLAMALPAAADGAHGAVGVATKTGFVAFVTGKATQEEALAEVEGICTGEGQTCDATKTYENQCAALARSQDDDTYGVGIEDTPAQAQATALTECTDHEGVGCNIHDTYCSPRSLND